MTTPTERPAEDVLIAHQRHSPSHCLCGWSELGHSHAGHQVQMLADAGLLPDREEWGVRRIDGRVFEHETESSARQESRIYADYVGQPRPTVRRYVTDWEEVPDGE